MIKNTLPPAFGGGQGMIFFIESNLIILIIVFAIYKFIIIQIEIFFIYANNIIRFD